MKVRLGWFQSRLRKEARQMKAKLEGRRATILRLLEENAALRRDNEKCRRALKRMVDDAFRRAGARVE